MIRLTAIALCLALTGCAGTAFRWADARTLRNGMTKDQVRTAMKSPPYSVRTQGDGREVWVWSYANGLTGSSKAVAVTFLNGVAESVPVIPEEYED